jgi:hypothetical protein
MKENQIIAAAVQRPAHEEHEMSLWPAEFDPKARARSNPALFTAADQ